MEGIHLDSDPHKDHEAAAEVWEFNKQPINCSCHAKVVKSEQTTSQ